MAIVCTESPRYSALVKNMYDPSTGYCVDLISVTDATGMKLGTVLDDAGAILALAKAADATHVVVSEDVEGKTGAQKVLVIARGPVILNKEMLFMNKDVTDKAPVFKALAAKGIVVA